MCKFFYVSVCNALGKLSNYTTLHLTEKGSSAFTELAVLPNGSSQQYGFESLKHMLAISHPNTKQSHNK